MAENVEKSNSAAPDVSGKAKQPYVAPELEVIVFHEERHILAMSTEEVRWNQEEYDIE